MSCVETQCTGNLLGSNEEILMRNLVLGYMESLAISCSQAKLSSGGTGLHSIELLDKGVLWKSSHNSGCYYDKGFLPSAN